MTYWLVSNPNAGDKRCDREFWLDHLAKAGIRNPRCCSFEDTSWVEELEAGDVLMVAGGDGSANLGARLCLKTGATLAILPSGTANDFARNLDLPESPEMLCQLIAEGARLRVDVADFGKGIFLNVAHVGIGTLPAREARRSEKRLFGRFSYGVNLLRRVNARRGFRARIHCDKGVITGRWLSVAVANGGFFGGGNEIPETSVNNGCLSVVAVKPRPLIQLLATFVLVQLGRQSPRRSSTFMHLKARRCVIETGKPKTVTADGELIGKTPLEVASRPASLMVIGRRIVATGSRNSAAHTS
ncbi:diacylglycerol/lipid kinase family protein [Marinobacter persicus]|uniref:YegS/Rv2252/BmrU family lipid kinase n=1 Tax=Marinobacter persicus TaxID=930118 RepID=A0A2S6G9S1_9GAMM|nr:diacylglycerol kinase family protein [Marinobacter persicus]PPK53104.1 YegS/Rv2252/BmrU family lipid kinase [Marinobacter persicus]PPK55981.1 YegS/Rv2252/BmrU family lipid kinase [Marinobacter persicus]PPK59577.1 YegS/Rv2252/BmrU family lipid kinase [Marinobacter persicus]